MKYMKISYMLSFQLFFFSLFFMFLSFNYFYSMKTMFLEWEIFSFFSLSLIMTIIVDWMSLMFSSLVMFISSCVLFYSSIYMMGEKFFYRFIVIVYLFVLSMIFLIFSPNMISLLLGWDGLGLVSYCLVIYYQNMKSCNAGMVTILSNRVGDVAILLSIAWLFNFGSWNFFYLQFMYESISLKFLIVMVILAAMTKSAQLPFSAWLPAAMAAPTPVSSLVHSSTLVTAGVYLLIRFSFLIYLNDFLLFIGLTTMFMAGLSANYECDLKKIIALSTLSQLGLMIMIVGFNFKDLSFFHLMAHAMFKSLLFLCAGVFIHSYGDIQDMRLMSGLISSLPSSSFYFSLSSMALCGFPFLSGFFSKDMILEIFFSGSMNFFFFFLIFVSTMFTLSYTLRLSGAIFFNSGRRSFMPLKEEAHMIIPMSFLVFLSVFGGGWLSFFIIPSFLIFLPMFFKILIFFGLMMLIMAWVNGQSIMNFMLSLQESKSSFFFGGMWFLPLVTSGFFFPSLRSGLKFLKVVDHGWTEFFSGPGVGFMLTKGSSGTLSLNFLNLKFYLFMFFILFLSLLILSF